MSPLILYLRNFMQKIRKIPRVGFSKIALRHLKLDDTLTSSKIPENSFKRFRGKTPNKQKTVKRTNEEKRNVPRVFHWTLTSQVQKTDGSFIYFVFNIAKRFQETQLK